MKLLYIYLGFSILTFLLMWLQTTIWSHKFKRKYHDLLSKKQRLDFMMTLLNFIKTLIICFVPVLNIVIFYLFLFSSDKLEDSILKRVRAKLESEEYIENKETY